MREAGQDARARLGDLPADAPSSELEPVRDAVVIGGGIAGLAAAWDLRNRDVVVLEGTGRARRPHPQRAARAVLAEPRRARLQRPRLGHRPAGRRRRRGVAARARATSSRSSSTGACSSAAGPSCTRCACRCAAAERVALARAGARLRVAVARYERVAKPRPGESPAETRRRLLAHGDAETFSEWLGRAAGRRRPDVPRDGDALDGRAGGDHRGRRARATSRSSGAAARGSRATSSAAPARSSTASPPSSAGAIMTGAEVLEVADEGERVRVRYRQGGAERELLARHAIVATKAFDAARLIRDLPADTSSALNAIPYGPTVVMAMLTNETRPMPWDDLYALATPKRAFNMLFNTVNVLRPRSAVRAPGGSLMVYRAGHAALDDVRAARRRRRAGLPRRPLRDLPGGARHRERDDPAQAAAHAAVRGARAARRCSPRSSGRSAASTSPATTSAASTPTPRSRAARRPRWPCARRCRRAAA